MLVGGARRGLLVSGVICGVLTSGAVLGVVFAADRLATLTESGPGPRLAGRKATLFGSLVGSEEIAAEIERRVRPQELVATESFTKAHIYAFLSGGTLETRLAKLTGGRHGLSGLYWYPPNELVGRDVLYVTERPSLEVKMRPLFVNVSREPDFEVKRGRSVVRRVAFFRCQGLLHPEGVFTRLSAGDSPR
jgi:hypothetical protein